MRLLNRPIACLLLALFLSSCWGCKTATTTTAVSGGYQEVSHPVRTYIILSDPQPPRVSFEHKNGNGRSMLIWPALYGVNEAVSGDLAVFVGDTAYLAPERSTRPRLFAVRFPNLPVDITDEVLREWAQATGRSFAVAEDWFTYAMPVEKNGRLELELDFSPADISGGPGNWPRKSALLVTWGQLDGIMRDVKAHGVRKTDLGWKTPYIAETAQ